MAEQKGNILGEVRGKLGNELYRKINGKIFISKVTGKHNTSQLPHEIDKRSRHKVNGKFASVILKSGFLKAVWEKEKAPCTRANNKICKINYHLCEPDHPSAKAQITPGGFKLEIDETNILPDRTEIIPRPIKLQTNESCITYIMILSLSIPKRRSKKTNDFEFLLMENYQAVDSRLSFTFSKEEAALIKKFKRKTIFLAALTLGKKQNIIRWSKSFGTNINAG